MDDKKKVYVPAAEQDQISRMLLTWLNGCPSKPGTIRFEYLRDDVTSISLSTIQGAYKVRSYITGGYMAEYQFQLIYRDQPSSDDGRLEMDEVLNAIADWATSRERIPPELGFGHRFVKIESNTRASLYGRFDNGDEDHTITMTMTYEVI